MRRRSAFARSVDKRGKVRRPPAVFQAGYHLTQPSRPGAVVGRRCAHRRRAPCQPRADAHGGVWSQSLPCAPRARAQLRDTTGLRRRPRQARGGSCREARKWRRIPPPSPLSRPASMRVGPPQTRADLEERQLAVAAKQFDERSRTCSAGPAGDRPCHCLRSESAAGVERAQTFPGPDPLPPRAIRTEPWPLGTSGRCDRRALGGQGDAHRWLRRAGVVRPGCCREQTFTWSDRCALAHRGAAEARSASISRKRLVSRRHLRLD